MLVIFIYFQDIDAQLEHQLKLKGTGDQGYRPCIAFIACNTRLEKNTKIHMKSVFIIVF